jgi:hypothetical protein
MKTQNVNWMKGVLFGAALLFVAACNPKDEPMGSGDVEFQITDAPSDDASIQSVFVTVTDLKVDGKSISGFTKQTIDLKAFSEGNTKLLGTARMDAKTYNNLTLVLDAGVDAFGNMPGCYVLTNDGGRFKLRDNGTIEIALTQSWSVTPNGTTAIVMDFDLRKAIRAMADATVRYNFVGNGDLIAAIRVVNKSKAGSISGTYANQSNATGDKIIVYAYKKGTFNATQETQGTDGIIFKSAVSSAEVRQGLAGTTYKLAFLEEGQYELHFAAYNKNATTNRFEFQTLLKSQADGSAAEFITIQAGITIAIATVITGSI